jgi:hypothetical protein
VVEERKENQRYLKHEIHHIQEWYEYPKKRFDYKNGLTLCVECHTKIHSWRVKTYKQDYKPVRVIRRKEAK